MFAGATGILECLSLIYALSPHPPCPLSYPLVSTHVNSHSWLSYRCVPIFLYSFVFVSLSPPPSASLLSITLHQADLQQLVYGGLENNFTLGRAEFGRRFSEHHKTNALLFVVRRDGG